MPATTTDQRSLVPGYFPPNWWAGFPNSQLDRTVFAVVNMAIGESLQATYDLTLPAGG